MKKVISFMVSIVMLFSITACGGKKYDELIWPTSDVAKMLPTPKSDVGEIISEDESSFYIKVGKTSKKDYQAYIEECKAKGFTVDYYNSDNLYTAKNEDGFDLYLSYSDDDSDMTVSLDPPVEETVSEAEESSESVSESEIMSSPVETEIIEESQTTESVANSENGIRPEFKEAMDSYEAFFDEYCEFMNKYKESDNSMSLMSDYADYMTKYTDTMTKMAELENEELSNEELNYYVEVTARITKKLSEIAQ